MDSLLVRVAEDRRRSGGCGRRRRWSESFDSPTVLFEENFSQVCQEYHVGINDTIKKKEKKIKEARSRKSCEILSQKETGESKVLSVLKFQGFICLEN